ncbi:hypothetical protein CCC_01262 [Paramagnetospirillum magnetotacticum MS-1]|uniref:Peptidase metallopeptidase domain-containing protein n=2 Tax=Paramagnetospirillum magnetotacticum TaxID=188 RepID=A0A0C2UZF6_PARME|nr:hypothetical protein CCC_01262 [Paramagnetospirillum magnetotacticum MS-1]
MATSCNATDHLNDLACTCTIKTVDPSLLVAAAARAVAINPANAPSRHLMAMAPDDVVLPPEHLAVLTNKYWGKNGVTLTVGFLDNPPADLRARILAHMNAWGTYANTHFAESNVDPQVRISRTAGDGYWSYLGTDVLTIGADKATMNLDSFTMNTRDSEFYRVVRHETGHTLGFPHEHRRKEIVDQIDFEKAVAYFMASQGWTREKVISQVLTPLQDADLNATADADRTSIMCYWLPGSIMKNGEPVVGGVDIDKVDADFAASIYPKPRYHAVYQQGDPGNGIGGYDLHSGNDRAFAFDYDHSGKTDHIALYRPATGTFWILKNDGGTFTPVYQQGDPGNGIGGYDLHSGNDLAFAFDYDHSGKQDHIALYRPGTGTFWILKNDGGTFTPVYQQGDPGNGIGGYDLHSGNDRAFAFDYDHSGKLDHIALYRPGTGTFWILKNNGGTFTPVYQQGDPGNGIGGYDLHSGNDRAFAFDYDHSGKQDHIALYRPGTGTFWILKNDGGAFSPVYQQGDPGNGIGGYDLHSGNDRAFAFDFENSGKKDHIALYRPGTGTFWVVRNLKGIFSPVYNEGDPGNGIGGYDLHSTADAAFAFDYDHSGKSDHIALYRPGTGTFWIVEKNAP